MNINFKIYFKDIEKKVLVKGSFDKYDWNKLRDIIIESSKKPDFKSKKKELKDKDDFILEFFDLPNNFEFSLSSFWNNKTYNFFLDNLKIFNEKNENEPIKNVKMNVIKVDKLPKWDLPKYDILLKDALENTWKKEEENIKNKLNNIELKNGYYEFIKKKYQDKNNEEIKEIKNNDIICNSCLSIDFIGPRYVCSHCNNYNLCKKCFFLGKHNPEHNFILFKKSIKDSNILKYRNKFNPSSETFKNIYDSFEVNFKVANTGEKDFQKCYFSNIKFTGNYLYCEKYIISENFGKNENKEIKLKINFTDKNEKIGIYEGYFRMFNEKGEPFGDILKIRVKNDKK